MKTRRMTPRQRKEVDTNTFEGRFGIRLKTLREKAGLTVEETAEALGVSLKMIYDYENGTYQPRVSSFPKIAKLYKVKRIKDLLPNE
jgi:transcriptional regulator with XRE-family HTH domain